MTDTATGRVEALWLKRAIRGRMDPVARAELIVGEGIEDDANRGRSRRQVTVIEREVFDRIRTRLPDASPEMRRANIMVSGVSLAGSRGRVLRVGSVRIRIEGETRPCERMDEQCSGLTQALEAEWGGGAYGVVLDSGSVRVGDAVSLEAPG
ncbi:MAG: MOSC domain-containing protein [Gemmatimonadota bacterium]|nr:MOSC domain-containing protein [Gemmatimonadota bacterium]MDH3421725.1 MOSC domain-containing protein [Gemmatimonadota bacterium]